MRFFSEQKRVKKEFYRCGVEFSEEQNDFLQKVSMYCILGLKCLLIKLMAIFQNFPNVVIFIDSNALIKEFNYHSVTFLGAQEKIGWIFHVCIKINYLWGQLVIFRFKTLSILKSDTSHIPI